LIIEDLRKGSEIMVHQILSEGNGKYALFSTMANRFFACDLTEQAVIDYYVDRAAQLAMDEAERTLKIVKEGGKAYHQFTLTWAEAYKTHRRTMRRRIKPGDKAEDHLKKVYKLHLKRGK